MQPPDEAARRAAVIASQLEFLGLKPGDHAYVRVELTDHPASDYTAINVRVGTKGYVQRFWVPTSELVPIPKEAP